jgi:SNF2 family DNA or RNA helicase
MPEPWRPHAGQRKAVRFLIEHGAGALFADPGVGKTSAVYAAFRFLKKQKLANRMLVIAPLRPAQMTWPAEAEKWNEFSEFSVAVLHGKDREKRLFDTANDVCVVNPEGLDWLLDARQAKSGGGRMNVVCDLKKFKAHGFDTLVIDELTMLKRTNTVRFKTLRAVMDTFSRRWGLTGTPAPNGLLDLFGQCFVLDGGRSLGRYVTHYRNTFFDLGYDGFTWKLKDGAEEKIYERLRPLVLRLAAEDYVDMPDLVENVIKFELPAAARRVYDELEDDLISMLESGSKVVAANSAAASSKIRQVCNGGVYIEDLPVGVPTPTNVVRSGKPWAHLHNGKTDLLEELLNELQGTPVLVAYEFKHDLERIQKRFGLDVPHIGGGTTEKRAKELEAAWNAGELPMLVGHPQSIGHGLNLQHAGNHVCFYAPIWNLELHDQFIGRVRRQGSVHKRVFVHYLVARDTIDEAIMWSLKAKAKEQDALLGALKKVRAIRK